MKICPRHLAAQKLKISLRTLDRYLKTNKLKFKLVGRHIFVLESDLQRLLKLKAQQAQAKTQPAPKKVPKKAQFTTEASSAVFTQPAAEQHSQNSMLQELYTQALGDLKTKQEKLEAASFRVGQLESELKNSVPLLEFRQRENELRKTNQSLQKRLVRLLFGLGGVIFLAALLALILIWQILTN